MDIVEPINPPGIESDPSPRQVVVAITARDQPVRTTVVLHARCADGQGSPDRAVCAVHAAPAPRPLTCLALVERIIGDWARTLRAAMLLSIALLGLIVVIIVAFGLGGVAVLGGLATALKLALRSHRKVASA